MNPLETFVFNNFSSVHFGDLRLEKRCERILATFSKADMTKGFPMIFSDQYELKSFYRFMNNKKVTREKLLSGYQSHLVTAYDQCLQKAADNEPGYWYLIQDTMYTDFTQRKSLKGSYTQTTKNKGFIFHHGLMLNHQFIPQGLLFQDVLSRDRDQFGKSHDKQKRPIEDKESYKWLQGLQSGAQFCERSGAQLIHIMDREGDILDVIQEAERLGAKYVIRSTHNRVLPQEEDKLWDTLRTQAPDTFVIRSLRDENGTTYQARCELKYRQITINGFNKPIVAVYLKELNPIDYQRKRKEDVEWLLLTNLKVEDIHTAEWIVTIYSARWLIEEFHHCLQSGGCEIESRQFRSDDVLLDCITFLSAPAIKLLISRYLAKHQPEESATLIFNEKEMEFAQKAAPRYLKPVDVQDCQPNSVLWAIMLLSRMGGHQGIRQKGLPGYQTLWRGWFKFDQQLQGYLLSKDP